MSDSNAFKHVHGCTTAQNGQQLQNPATTVGEF